MTETKHYSGFAALVGRPNVGKSTLMNAMIGEKIAIISDRPQTTRNKIMGILTTDRAQILFLDTPGIHKPLHKLGEYMNKTAAGTLDQVDVVLFVVDASEKKGAGEKFILERLRAIKTPVLLVINKIDALANKEDMVKKMVAISKLYDFEQVVPISVREKDGTDLLLSLIQQQAQEGPHFFPNDTLTDQPEKVIVAEIIREKVLRNMRDEIPHGTAVVIERMREREGKDIMDIDATILCEKSSHKGMIIGKKGAMLKKIASESRTEIESFLESRVNLQCWVKIREDWRNSEFSIRDLGFN